MSDGAPPRQSPASCQPPGEVLFMFEHRQLVYRVELLDFEPDGIEVHWFVNDDYAQACRSSDRALAIRWAKEKRVAVLRDVFDWP